MPDVQWADHSHFLSEDGTRGVSQWTFRATNPDGTEKEPEKKVVWNHWCFESPEQQKEQEKKLREAIGETKLPKIHEKRRLRPAELQQ